MRVCLGDASWIYQLLGLRLFPFAQNFFFALQQLLAPDIQSFNRGKENTVPIVGEHIGTQITNVDRSVFEAEAQVVIRRPPTVATYYFTPRASLEAERNYGRASK